MRADFSAIQIAFSDAFCERPIGSARRECLGFMIPIDEQHIRQIFKAWVRHYNGTRPHSSLGPGIPGNKFQKVEPQVKRHRIPEKHLILATSILGGLHHEYRLEKIAARSTAGCFCGRQPRKFPR
jgi:putative transposase